MTRYDVNKEYFDWLYNLACKERYSSRVSYKKLLTYLHSKPFRYLLSRDENRAEDGLEVRHMFIHECGYTRDVEMYIDGPCTMLEMILALCLKCEGIMDNAQIGDRTSQWFWIMIGNLGLGSMSDSRFDERYVDDVVERFLEREYEPNGRGGLFIIRNCEYDLRDVEIWHQLCWYLDTIM